jgi:WD40 repeat protein
MTRLLFISVLGLLLAPTPGLFAQRLQLASLVKITSELRFNCAVLSPNSKLVALGLGDTRGGLLQVWEVATGKEILHLDSKEEIDTLAFSPDGSLLASTNGRDQLTIWDVKGKERKTLKGHFYDTSSPTFSADGKTLGATGAQEVKIWDVATGKEITSFKVGSTSSYPMAFSKDLKRLASPNFQEIDLWDTAKGKETATLSEHRGEVGSVAFTADGKGLVAASHWCRNLWRYEGQIKIWDLATGKERTAVKGQFGMIFRPVLSPNGKTLALLDTKDIDGDGELRVLDVGTGQVLFRRVGQKQSLFSLEYRPDGTLFVFEALGKDILLWKLPPAAGK